MNSSMNSDATQVITITDAEGAWIGTGTVIESGQIVDCDARLGETADDTERIYSAIEDEIEAGRSCGVTDGYAWELRIH